MSQIHITTNHTLTTLKEVLDLLNFGTREAILVIKGYENQVLELDEHEEEHAL